MEEKRVAGRRPGAGASPFGEGIVVPDDAAGGGGGPASGGDATGGDGARSGDDPDAPWDTGVRSPDAAGR